MTDTVNNSIPLVPENTTDPAAGLNLAIDTIDALLQLAVLGIETAPPSGSSDGDRYIVDTGATGDWAGEDGKIARYVATGDYWQFHSANYALNEADSTLYVFDGVNDWWEQSIPLDEFITNSIIVKGLVKDRDLTAPPGSPAEGDAYIPAATAIGAWVGHEDEIAAWINGAWFFVTPIAGQSLWVEDEAVEVRWEGSSWVTRISDGQFVRSDVSDTLTGAYTFYTNISSAPVRIRDNSGVGAASEAWIMFQDSAGGQTGYVGKAIPTDSNLYVNSLIGSVVLADNGSIRLKTTATGVEIIGAITADTLSAGNGATGSFTTTDGKTVTVTDGIVTGIV